MKKLCRFLDGLSGWAEVGASWQRYLGDEFEGARAGLLRKADMLATAYPCPEDCGCAHKVIHHDNGKIVTVCRCEEMSCDNIPLTEEDLVVYEVNWAKTGRAIARAFGLDPKPGDFLGPGTLEFATFGGAALPAVLTMQPSRQKFRAVVAELSARQRGPFILFAPTSRFMDAGTHELLANSRAGFFDLESHVTLLPSGWMQGRRSGGELFSRLLPANEEAVTENEAGRLFTLMRSLDAGQSKRKAPLEKVFRLYVMENRSRDEVARLCKCVPGLVSARLREIESRMGRPVTELRAFGSRLGEMNAGVTDSRAKSTYRKRMAQ